MDELFSWKEGHPKMPPGPFPKKLAATVVTASAAIIPIVVTATAGTKSKARAVAAEEKQ